MWGQKHKRLLQALQYIGSTTDDAKTRIGPGYFPVSEHLRLLDPEVVLVVGPRGSGKTTLARILTDEKLVHAVASYSPVVHVPRRESDWISAYPSAALTINARELTAYLKQQKGTTESVRDLWLAHLVRLLYTRYEKDDQAALTTVAAPHGLDEVMAAFGKLGTTPVIALDRLEARLAGESRHLIVIYDDLDNIGGGEWTLRAAMIRGLVAFWAAYARRWQRIRAKIFLRTDLYDRHATAGGADLAKLAMSRVELEWCEGDLYGALLARMANADAEIGEYVRQARGIVWRDDSAFGAIPTVYEWKDARPVIERMAGEYMDSNRRLVCRWIVEAVRDGRGRALPRPLLRLIAHAAKHELQHPNSLRWPRVMSPESLRRALASLSEDQMNEWPWLTHVKELLTANPVVPWPRERDVQLMLEGVNWHAYHEHAPAFAGRELLEYLLEIGVLQRHPGGLIDVPDLYLRGLELRRKNRGRDL